MNDRSTASWSDEAQSDHDYEETLAFQGPCSDTLLIESIAGNDLDDSSVAIVLSRGQKTGGITHGEVDGTDTEAIFEDEDRMVSSIENAFTERQGHIPDLVELETEIHGEPIR